MSSAFSNRTSRLMSAADLFLHTFNDPVFSNRAQDPLACDFALGNPQEMPLPNFVEALRNSLVPRDKDWFAYKLSEPGSRQAVADHLKHWRGVDTDLDDILLTNGAFAGLAVCLNAVVDPGEEVIFLSPPWFFYEALILAAGGTPVRVKVDPVTFDPDLDAIRAAITPRTRAIIVNSPNNPTGRIYGAGVLTGLADLLHSANAGRERPITLISDEAYSRIIFDGAAYVSPTSFYPHSLLVYTYGKTLLTPGQRIGFIALPPEMPERENMRLSLFMAQITTGYAFPNALLQHALPDLNQLSISIPALQERRNTLVQALTRMGYQVHSPQGTFYLLPRSPIDDDLAFMNVLAAEHIYCLPGTAVEMPGYFRISFTASEEMIQRALPGFQRALEKARAGQVVAR